MKTATLILATLLLCSTVNAQTDLVDIGKIGISTSTPQAKIDINGMPYVGAQKVINIATGEPGSGNYGISYFANEGNNGETRHDNVLCMGYNVPGPGNLADEHQWHQCWESLYNTWGGRRQSEYYITAAAINGVVSRPLAIDFYHDDGSTMVGAYTQQFVIGSPVDSNPWLRFQSSPTAGIVSMVRDSKIDFAGNTREWFITKANLGFMGQSGNVFELFQGGWNEETVHFFKNSDPAYGLTIKIGNSGNGLKVTGPRWSVTGAAYSGYSDIQTAFDVDVANTSNKTVKRGASGEVNVSSVKVNGVQTLGTRCGAIPDATESITDNTRAINDLLDCLRSHGAVAP